jgi:hypothetical protein
MRWSKTISNAYNDKVIGFGNDASDGVFLIDGTEDPAATVNVEC